jgi:1-acyl-sn-glycerol-3-phosphate acyltransferase
MSDPFYTLVRTAGRHVFWISSRRTVLHRERTDLPGPFILAANHHSAYDIPVLVCAIRRHLDFLCAAEFGDRRFVGPFFRVMNCTFVDRTRGDPAAARQLLERLAAGRTIAMFPEARIRKPHASVTAGGPFNPGVVHLALSSGCPILPAVVLGAGGYDRIAAWFPFSRTRYGINFGEPFHVTDFDAGLAQLRAAYLALTAELTAAMQHLLQNGNRVRPAGCVWDDSP